MTYIQRSDTNANLTPFDIGKMSGSTAIGAVQVFDDLNAPWLSFNSSTGAITATSSFWTEATFSPDSNAYGGARSGDTSGPDRFLQGQIMPESSNTGVGGLARGDDVAVYYSTSQFPTWLYSASINLAPDTALTHLKIMRF